MLWNTYDEYKKFMKSKKATPLSEEIWKREYGPKESTLPLQITPKKRDKIGDHCKVVNQIRDTRAKRKKEAAKKPESVKAPTEPKPKKPPMTLEQKREQKREYMKRWHKNNPNATYQHVKNWRERHPDQHRTYNREWKRNRAKQTASTSPTPTSGTTTTKHLEY